MSINKRNLGCVLLALCAPTFIGGVFYWSNYYRTADYLLRWTTGQGAGFSSYGPNFDQDGNPKVLLLLPGNEPRCYLITYSRKVLDYLRQDNKSTVPVTLELKYSFGKIYGFAVLRIGNYKYAGEFSQMAHEGSGSCVEHLDRYAEPPGPGRRH